MYEFGYEYIISKICYTLKTTYETVRIIPPIIKLTITTVKYVQNTHGAAKNATPPVTIPAVTKAVNIHPITNQVTIQQTIHQQWQIHH